MCVLSLSTISVGNIPHSKRNSGRCYKKMYVDLHVKYPLFLSDPIQTWIFSTYFQKNTQISNFMKILPMGAELFHVDRRTDGQTDMTKIIVAFRNFTNAPKDHSVSPYLRFASQSKA